jgi:hypothetical protein
MKLENKNTMAVQVIRFIINSRFKLKVHMEHSYETNARISCDNLQNKLRSDLTYSIFFEEDISSEWDRSLNFFNSVLTE